MNIEELTKRALHIKNLYSTFEKTKNYKSWGVEETYVGLVSDVGDLGRLVLTKEGFRDYSDLDKNLQHELAEILWAVLLLSNNYNIDLTEAFLNEMSRLEKNFSL